jgi:hypothetical protein
MDATLAQLILPRNSGANGFPACQLIRLADMGKPKKQNRNISDADRRAAQQLRAAWDQRKRERAATDNPLLQEKFAAKLGAALGRTEPTTQSLVSQYLTGAIALNYKALLAFAEELQWPATDIRNDLPEQQNEDRDPLKNLHGDIKALRFAMLGVIGMISEMTPAEAANVETRILAATEKEPVFRKHGYLGSLLKLLEEGRKRAATSSATSPRRVASQASKR